MTKPQAQDSSQTQADSHKNKRLPQLDVLRAIAVLAVIGFHSPRIPPDSHQVIKLTHHLLSRVGWAGVDLFFVLSGFLVSGLLFSEYKKNDGIQVKRFLIRRGFKIYPAYYFFLLTGLLIVPFTWEALVSEALFIQNYGPHIWGHTWSLAVEEHFYILLGVTLYFLAKKKRMEAILPVLAGVAVLCLLFRLLTQEFSPSPANHRPTHLRLDSLGFGVLIAYFFHFRPSLLRNFCEPKAKLLIFLGATCGLGAAYYDYPNWWFFTLGPTALYLSFGVLLVGAIYAKPSKSLWSRLLARIGYYSYSIYLWHIPAFQLTAKAGPYLLREGASIWVILAVYPLLSLTLGVLTAHLIEQPLLKVREFYFPPSSKPSQPTTAPDDNPLTGSH